MRFFTYEPLWTVQQVLKKLKRFKIAGTQEHALILFCRIYFGYEIRDKRQSRVIVYEKADFNL
ncbi:uncharacterized protein PHALS_04888 [Plasmopara halstedii]|uniref:Uncharacterized protein n=1 Tax=Plasmopara halstedii TaxID=4781 RepID=A0A0P1B307_PLAHL|nr:uncharacterized protein PHALS_04888 [Plasmopara halstedii]CEG47745.1 hypothetical protein PHALS_04888 [Plasmopara halstedii]|eukprot:XP_024584114.1 hypothetical protein PHALS_04888 [Plasmopara halstedii]